MKRITLTDELYSELKSALEDSAIYYPANTDDDAEERAKWQAKHDALVAVVHEAENYTEPPESVKPIVITDEDGEKRFACPKCKSTEFSYDEDVAYSFYMEVNDGERLTFPDGTSYDGNSDPGVVCANFECGADIDDSEIEVEFG